MRRVLVSGGLKPGKAMSIPHRILAIQLRRIGDVLMCTPAVRALRETWPQSYIAFLVEQESADVLKLNPHLNELLILDRNRYRDPVYWMGVIRRLRKRRFDLTVDFLGNPRTSYLSLLSGARQRLGYRTARRRAFYNLAVKTDAAGKYSAAHKLEVLEALGIHSQDVRLDFFISQEARSFAREFFDRNRVDRKGMIISMSPTSRRRFRRWPAERFAELTDWLISEFGATVILVWGPGEKGVVEQTANKAKRSPLICRETRSLLELGAVLEGCDLHIGNDNGTKHMAVALGKPTLTVFGPEDPVSWTYPDPTRHKFVKAQVNCRDCHKVKNKCSSPTCLDEIQVKDVQETFRDLLTDLKRSGEKGLTRKIEYPAAD
jgi:heptosyltransferase-3